MASAEIVRCSGLRWIALIGELRRRGGAVRESGAFLLGRRKHAGARILDVCFYDDIDPGALAHGYVRLSGPAMNEVWRRCEQNGLEVVADVHTHPGCALQSESDQAHPMISLRGHVALIVPNLARSVADYRNVGVYRYVGAKQWRTCPAPRVSFLDLAL
jgi:proteasome lid subunit RPN8/RPN11